MIFEQGKWGEEHRRQQVRKLPVHEAAEALVHVSGTLHGAILRFVVS